MNTVETTVKQWIVETPFNRRQYSSVTNGTVDYSGYLYNNKGPNFTPEQYLADPISGAKYNNPRIVSDSEFMELYEQSERDMMTNFREVTEAQYYEALECLPPMKWHDITKDLNVFFISEGMTGYLHDCYLSQKSTGKYYSALRSKFETDEELTEVFNRSIV